MKINKFIGRTEKVLRAITHRDLAWPLFFHFVLAASEHRRIIDSGLMCCVDIGANRGQFSLAVRHWAPQASIIAFEPLPVPSQVFRDIFNKDTRIALHECAIGPHADSRQMHVSLRDDSSSLLPISDLQAEIFPGTAEASTLLVKVSPLDCFLCPADIFSPSLLKLDVQGFEYEALLGCESLLPSFDQVYSECSFVELYSGQKLAADVIEWLACRGFHIEGIYNPSYDSNGRAVQADFLFRRI